MNEDGCDTATRRVMFHAVFRLAQARLREFVREPVALFWVFGFPLSMLIVLGFSFTDRPPESLHIEVVGAPDSDLRNRLRSSLATDRRIIIDQPTNSPLQRLQRVESSLVLEVLDGKPDSDFRLTFDPDRPDSVHTRAIAEMHIARLGGNAPSVEVLESRTAGGRYIDFLVPGLLAVNAMGASLVWFGYGLVEMRMFRLLRVLLATPLRTSDFMLGMLLARWVLLVPETVVVLLVSNVIFGVALKGSVAVLVGVQLLGATTFAAIGLLIGSRARRLESASGWLSVLMLSQWVFCGVFFARSVFPIDWQPLITWLPLSLYVDAARSVMLDGAGVIAIAPQAAGLCLWSVASAGIGLAVFRAE